MQEAVQDSDVNMPQVRTELNIRVQVEQSEQNGHRVHNNNPERSQHSGRQGVKGRRH